MPGSAGSKYGVQNDAVPMGFRDDTYKPTLAENKPKETLPDMREVLSRLVLHQECLEERLR